MPDQVYTVFDESTIFSFEEFTMAEKCADAPTLSYKYSIIETKISLTFNSFEREIKFDQLTRTFKFRTDNM